MVLVHKSLAVASCTVCLASAFIGSPQRAPTTTGRGGGYHYRRDSPLSGVSSIAAGSPRRHDGAAVVPLLLSSRTVDVDVIDVTDVTEEEARREKEQVRLVLCFSSCFVVVVADATMLQGTLNLTFPGSHDVKHGRWIYPPDVSLWFVLSP